jgi:tight adherence protein C
MVVELIIMLLGVATVILVVVGLMMKTERQIIMGRIRMYGFKEATDAPVLAEELVSSLSDRLLRPVMDKVGKFLSGASPGKANEQLNRMLEAAGRPHNLNPAEFLALKVAGLLVGLAIGVGLTFITQYGRMQEIAIAALPAIVGYLLPGKWLSGRIRWRHNEMLRALPNTIDLLNVSVEAGLGFDGAIARIVEKSTGPLADELARALREMRMGKSRVDALRDMAHRTDVMELGSFVAAIYQAEELGASLTSVLRAQGHMIRQRRSARARDIAAKLPIKMLFPLIFFVFPSIFVVILGPAIIQLSKTYFVK